MGLIYTRKKDDFEEDEKTMNATEFIDRMFARQADKVRKEDNIESPK